MQNLSVEDLANNLMKRQESHNQLQSLQQKLESLEVLIDRREKLS